MTKEKTFPKQRKDKAHNLPAKRTRPKGGWVTDPVKTTEHGHNGRIVIMREIKKQKERLERAVK